MSQKYWLMKSEPSVFSFDDLLKSPHKTTGWEGVRNYQARNFMRDEFKIGDGVLFYHSSTDTPAIIGTAKVVREAYEDASANNPKSDYYDPKQNTSDSPRWLQVDIQAVKKFQNPITLEYIKKNKKLQSMLLIKKGQRLSIQPVTKTEWDELMKLGFDNP